MLITALFLQVAAPVIPAGLNQQFVGTSYAIEQKLALGAFNAAAQLASLLPKPSFTVGWDDSKVPANRRGELRLQRDKAIAEWNSVPGVSITARDGNTGDVLIDFVEALPQGSEEIPGGAEFEFNNLESPRLHATVALKRSNPLVPVSGVNIHNEVAFAIAQYLGLERAAHFGPLSSRTDQDSAGPTMMTPMEHDLAANSVQLASQLRNLVAKHEQLSYSVPHIELESTSIKGLNGTQGKPLGFEFGVRNTGSADLMLQVLPDCGCLRPEAPNRIAPGQTGTVRAEVNTTDFVGHLKHNLMVYSNDGQQPITFVPVEMNIEPLYRFVRPGPEALQLRANGADADVYMLMSPKAGFEPLMASVYGAKGNVTITKWNGTLRSDPENPQVTKSGYKLHVHVDPIDAAGRIPASLVITTDSDEYRVAYYTFYLQRGIIAMPGQVYLGEISQQPTHFAFLVSRPGEPFKITKVTSQPPFFSASYVPMSESEYRVDVDYNGKADPGDFTGTISVHTDDPHQPVVSVPVRMIVR